MESFKDFSEKLARPGYLGGRVVSGTRDHIQVNRALNQSNEGREGVGRARGFEIIAFLMCFILGSITPQQIFSVSRYLELPTRRLLALEPILIVFPEVGEITI